MKDVLSEHLSKKDLADLMALSHQSLSCKTEDQLGKLISDLRDIFEFENACCAHAKLPDALFDSSAEIGFLNVSYPEGFMSAYLEHNLHQTDAVVCEFLTELSPVNWLKLDQRLDYSYAAATLARDYKMIDGWTHGTLDLATMNCTIISIGGPKPDGSIRTQKIIEYITPFYAEAYNRVLNKPSLTPPIFTAREIEVLQWIKEGKSSWEISEILKCSKRGIDFHSNNIKAKLNAVSRAQAVAIALKKGIIQF